MKKLTAIVLFIFICSSNAMCSKYVKASDIVNVNAVIYKGKVTYNVLVANSNKKTATYVVVSKKCYTATLLKLGTPIYNKNVISVELF